MNTCKILTTPVLESDRPLYDFLVIDELFPKGYWPNRETCQKLKFVQFGDVVMENLFHCFYVEEIFDCYEISYYRGENDLGALINNLESEMKSIQALSKLTQFRERFPYSFDRYLTNETVDDDGIIFVKLNWSDIRDDLVKILACIRNKAADCIKTGKVLAIVGL